MATIPVATATVRHIPGRAEKHRIYRGEDLVLCGANTGQVAAAVLSGGHRVETTEAMPEVWVIDLVLSDGGACAKSGGSSREQAEARAAAFLRDGITAENDTV